LCPFKYKGEDISYEYDRAGNLVKQILPNGGVIINEYDEMNRKIKVTDPDETPQEFL